MIEETNSFNKDIGTKIKGRRQELKLTQTKLGNKLGVTFQQVQKYEKGVNAVSVINELKFCEFFDCDRGYFVQPITENGYKFLHRKIDREEWK